MHHLLKTFVYLFLHQFHNILFSFIFMVQPSCFNLGSRLNVNYKKERATTHFRVCVRSSTARTVFVIHQNFAASTIVDRINISKAFSTLSSPYFSRKMKGFFKKYFWNEFDFLTWFFWFHKRLILVYLGLKMGIFYWLWLVNWSSICSISQV